MNNDSKPSASFTSVIRGNDSEIFLVPAWAKEHVAGGHMDPAKSTGSTFSKDIDVEAVFQQLATNSGVQTKGNMRQLDSSASVVGFSAVDSTHQEPNGYVIKFESPARGKPTSAVLAPAYGLTLEGVENQKTSTVSAIAPPTNNIDFVPDDVKDNPAVLKALEAGKLRTFVTAFPGPAIVNSREVPRVSGINEKTDPIVFKVFEGSQFFVSSKDDPKTIFANCAKFNEKSFSRNNENTSDEKMPIEELRKMIKADISADVKVTAEFLSILSGKKDSPEKSAAPRP